MSFKSISQIIDTCIKNNCNFDEVVIADDCNERGVCREESFEHMRNMFLTMIEASNNYDSRAKSRSGLVGGDGHKMSEYINKGNTYSGDYISQVIMEAIKMGESNACMKRIVAAPTAGSCGVLPAVLLPLYSKEISNNNLSLSKSNINIDNLDYTIIDKYVRALYVAAGIGQVLAKRAFISGAAGGCQAEIGSAATMAAGALTYLKGGDAKQISSAAAMCMKNMLGLVCDPVAGLVEVPCVKRNVVGGVNAVASADMALAGIESQIPADQMIDAMREVGENMNPKYKETAKGGCAATARGLEIQNNCMKI